METIKTIGLIIGLPFRLIFAGLMLGVAVVFLPHELGEILQDMKRMVWGVPTWKP